MNPWDRWCAAWEREAEDLRKRGGFRTLGESPESKFAHNDYLGLRRHPQIRKALIEAVSSGLPFTSSGSRLLSGNLPLFRGFETEFAQCAGMPEALLFSSASEANRVAISALVDRRGIVIHDALAHASLIDGILHSGAKRRKFRHNDPEDLRTQLGNAKESVRLVVTEAVFSMDGDVAPLSELLKVCMEEDALLLVDEAHSVGLYGAHRTGLCEALPRSPHLVATTHGFGKALASAGGMLCAPGAVIEKIVNTSRAFIFTTAPSPLAVCAAEAAWKVARTDLERRQHLDALCNRMSLGLENQGWLLPQRPFQTPIFPILTGGLEKAVALSDRLRAQGVHLRPIRRPTVAEGTERLRATVTADLDPSDLETFLEVLSHV